MKEVNQVEVGDPTLYYIDKTTNLIPINKNKDRVVCKEKELNDSIKEYKEERENVRNEIEERNKKYFDNYENKIKEAEESLDIDSTDDELVL